MKDEIVGVIDFIDYVYKLFGFKYHVELSTRPESSMGSEEEGIGYRCSQEALEDKGMDYIINEGDGALRPKIDFTWRIPSGGPGSGTIQLDFQMPQRFDLTYVGSDGEKHRPVMIHRVIFGSIGGLSAS